MKLKYFDLFSTTQYSIDFITDGIDFNMILDAHKEFFWRY